MKTSPATLSTSRKVFLRYPEPGDFEELAELYRSGRNHLRGLANPTFERRDFDRILAYAEVESNEYFLICRTSDGKIAGTIHLSQIFRKGFQNAYLGYMLGADFTGNGYMTEAVRSVLRFAFHELRLHRVEANVQPTNKASIAVLKRCGFSLEGFSRRYLKIGGRWRDHERWAILKEDLQKNTK